MTVDEQTDEVTTIPKMCGEVHDKKTFLTTRSGLHNDLWVLSPSLPKARSVSVVPTCKNT